MSRKDNLLLMKSWERLKNSILKRLSELLRSLDGSPQEAEGVEAHLGREQTPPQSYFSCCCDPYPDKTVEGRIGFFWGGGVAEHNATHPTAVNQEEAA